MMLINGKDPLQAGKMHQNSCKPMSMSGHHLVLLLLLCQPSKPPCRMSLTAPMASRRCAHQIFCAATLAAPDICKASDHAKQTACAIVADDKPGNINEWGMCRSVTCWQESMQKLMAQSKLPGLDSSSLKTRWAHVQTSLFTCNMSWTVHPQSSLQVKDMQQSYKHKWHSSCSSRTHWQPSCPLQKASCMSWNLCRQS